MVLKDMIIDKPFNVYFLIFLSEVIAYRLKGHLITVIYEYRYECILCTYFKKIKLCHFVFTVHEIILCRACWFIRK
jgi:hypothetical protein